MSVNMQQVKELRDRTQAGLNDCRSALVEAAGDMEKAVEIILKKGLAKSAKRAGAIASEGLVVADVRADGKSAVIVEVNIQTDFAARNEDFVAFASKVVKVAAEAPAGADLGGQPFPGGGTVEDARAALVGRLGENITVRRWDRVELAGPGRVHAYVHLGGKVGAVVALELGDETASARPEVAALLDDLAMHVAAMAPVALAREDFPASAVEAQRGIFEAQLAEEGKVPEARRPQIVEGKLAKWLKEGCLLEQPSVTQPEKTVSERVAELGQALGTSAKLVRFVRFERGEGIQKPAGDDFATEVAKMAGS